MKSIFKMGVVAAALAGPLAWGQVTPDAGQILREMTPAPPAIRQSPTLELQAPAANPMAAGGVQVVLQSLTIEGATVIAPSVLRDALGDVIGQSFDLAGLRELAVKISNHYHAAGYPFAHALVPPEDWSQGNLRIEVVEGRYGTVKALGDPAYEPQVQRYLAPLIPGQVIESQALERTTLLIADLPGLALSPVMRPGQALGTGDLDVRISRTEPINGEVSFDNHGNVYSGPLRAHVSVNLNSPLMLGDKLSALALRSNERLWLVSLDYSAPLGTSGLRGNIGYAYTAYDLGRGLEGNKGTAKVSVAGLSYPIIRSQKANLNLSVMWEDKQLFDSRAFGAVMESPSMESPSMEGPTTTVERYAVTSLPMALQFDLRDSLGGGAISYGVVSWTPGKLKNKTETPAHFTKLNLEAVRLQNLGGDWSLYSRVRAQATGRNLDSAEGFSLGGPSGIRAYPTGEASGDEGGLVQIELRWTRGAFMPFVFYDHGRVKVDAQPEQVVSPVADKERAGVGVGLRYALGRWNFAGVLAWRTQGGAPESVTSEDPRPRAWFNAGYHY